MNRKKDAALACLALTLTLLILFGIGQYGLRAQIIGGASPKLVDAALDGTETANSIGRAVRQLFLEATVAAPVANSMANRIIAASFAGYTTSIPVVRPSGAVATTLTAGTPAWGNPASWTEIIPASSITTDFVIAAILVHTPEMGTTSARQFELDLGTGAGGSEALLGTFAPVYIEHREGSTVGFSWVIVPPFTLPFPLSVTANVRVAGRIRSSVASASILVKLMAYPLPL